MLESYTNVVLKVTLHRVRSRDPTGLEFGNSVLEAIEGSKCQMLQEARGRRFGMLYDWCK